MTEFENADMEPESRFSTVPIEVTVSVGRAKPLIRDLLSLGCNSILELDRRVDDPVELYVGDKMIAKGNLEEMDGADGLRLSVRLTEIIDLDSGIN